VPQSHHPHKTFFDSPVCKDILSEMTHKIYAQLDVRSIELEHLDITSYLSVPNRFNSCNKHVRTVYHIFTDLIDMSWQKRHTSSYNIAKHRSDKVVEKSANETTQMHKAE